MGFQNKSQAAELTDLELETKKQTLLEDITFISSKIEEAKKIEAEYNQKSFDIEDLDLKLNKKKNDLESLDLKINNKRKELESLGTQVIEDGQLVVNLNKSIQQLQGELAEIDQASKLALDKLENEVKEKTRTIQELNQALESQTKLCDLAEDEIRDNATYLEEQEKSKNTKAMEIAILAAEITDLNKTLDNLGKEIKEKQDYATTLAGKLEVAGNELIKASGEAADILKAANEYKEKVEKELTEREGRASVKESWLTEKEQILKNTKEELEKFYNRPINNVKF